MKAKIHICISVFLLAVITFASVPKVYIHSLLGHNHTQHHSSKYLAVSENNETQDCAFEKFDTTVAYTINDFYSNFVATNAVLPIYKNIYQVFYFKFQFNNSLLRGPPVA